MRIAILTQPLGHNYGGLLQAFALQKHLQDQGHTVETLDRRSPETWTATLSGYGANIAKLLLGRIGMVPTKRRHSIVYRELIEFRDRNIVMSERIASEEELRNYCRQNRFDAFVVGSDQVWRPQYSPSLTNYFLDFVDDVEPPACRLSYAASFGVDYWEYPSDATTVCRALLERFDAVSVREQSGVRLCEEHFGRTAQCVPDPTLLLGREDYEARIGANSKPDTVSPGGVLTYILDNHACKQAIVEKVVDGLGTNSFSVKPEKSLREARRAEFDACRYPGVDVWLRSFRDADFVVTDSFHGTVFAILFCKPFLSVGNSRRGLSRFESLLSQFGLRDRLVDHTDQITTERLHARIDWDRVENMRRRQQALGIEFLSENLQVARRG